MESSVSLKGILTPIYITSGYFNFVYSSRSIKGAYILGFSEAKLIFLGYPPPTVCACAELPLILDEIELCQRSPHSDGSRRG